MQDFIEGKKQKKKSKKKKKKKEGGQLPNQKNQKKIWFVATNVPFKLIYKYFVVGNNQAQLVIEAYEFFWHLLLFQLSLYLAP